MIANPQGLWYLLLLLPIALLVWARYWLGKRDLIALTGGWRRSLTGNLFVVKWFFSSISILLFTAFAVLALSGVSWGRYPVSTDYSGTDVSVAVDISRSMLAEDIYPSRIARAAGVLRQTIDANAADRFDVVVFKGTAVDVVPPTLDREALTSITRVLGPSMLTSPGTDIARGIRAALKSFPAQDAARHVILLFTDGGSLSGDPVKAARAAAAQHVPIYVVACGTQSGGPIPLGNGSFVEDANGNRVITRLELSPLREVAQVSGGKLLMLSDPRVMDQIDSLIGQHLSGGSLGSYRFQTRDQYRVFVVCALLCLCIYLAARIIRWRGIL